MITLHITTSAQTLTFELNLPVEDNIALHYDSQCKYCDKDIRTETIREYGREFCVNSHRTKYWQKGIADEIYRPKRLAVTNR